MKKYAALICVLLLATTGCQSVKKELGIGRNSPDEFMVVKRAPLTLPPDFDLRAPSPEGQAPAAAQSSSRAQEAVMGQVRPADGVSTPEAVLLAKLGANEAQPDIRNVLNREAGYLEFNDKTLADRLIFWKDGTTNMDGDALVDAAAERDRLAQKKAEGKPVNDGDVPVIKRRKGTIDKLF
jgi:hypothetical protein